MSNRYALTKTPHRESPAFETKHDVCRECRHIQPCVVMRGWCVCYGCLSQIDRLFCEWRAQDGEVGAREPELAAALDWEPVEGSVQKTPNDKCEHGGDPRDFCEICDND